MRNALVKGFTLTALIGLALGSSACSRVRGQQGYLTDSVLTSSIQAGIDNRTSVEKTLGRPSFIGQFTPNDWYYFSRQTKQLAFALPKPVSQSILHVQFDSAGNVANVSTTGLEKVANIRTIKDRTPTLGKNRSFFEDIFGNIGQVGSVGQGGDTADNPN
jgi:outer membrane protein assembly factor BamE (lipoprotein component of BamABCDE complex)